MTKYDPKARHQRYLANRKHALEYRKDYYNKNQEREKADSLARYNAKRDEINAKRRKKNKRKTT